MWVIIMGYVRVKAFVGDAHKRKVMEVILLVDTSSLYPVIPPNTAKELFLLPYGGFLI